MKKMFVAVLFLIILSFGVNTVMSTEEYFVTVDQSYVTMGITNTVSITVTDSEYNLLSNIYVGLNGAGIDSSTFTDTNGKAVFSIVPTGVGNISISVGSSDNMISENIVSTGWVLDINVSPLEVEENGNFTVNVTISGSSIPVEGAFVKIYASDSLSGTTDSNGQVLFKAPDVVADREFTITASKDGYAPDTDIHKISVLNVPHLVIDVDDEVVESIDIFDVLVGHEGGWGVGNVLVTFNGETKTTNSYGLVNFTAPDVQGDYTITATHEGYIGNSIDVRVVEKTIASVEEEIMPNEYFTINVKTDEGIPVCSAKVYIIGDESNYVETNSLGNATLKAPYNKNHFSVMVEKYNSSGKVLTERISISVNSSTEDLDKDYQTTENDVMIPIILTIIVVLIISIILFFGFKNKKT